MTTYAVHVCSFQAGPDVTRRTRYEALRRAVLKAGRFSVFEAMESARSARMFTRLCRDPAVETFALAFPWTGVRKPKPPPRSGQRRNRRKTKP